MKNQREDSMTTFCLKKNCFITELNVDEAGGSRRTFLQKAVGIRYAQNMLLDIKQRGLGRFHVTR